MRALCAARRERERESDDISSIETLPLASLLALLGGGSEEPDLLRGLLGALVADLDRVFVIALCEGESPPIEVDWSEEIHPLRVRARVIAELYRRKVTPTTRDAA